MLTIEEARTRVARGAARLDQYVPNWFDRIDEIELDMANPNCCIVGQVFKETRHAVGPYIIGLNELQFECPFLEIEDAMNVINHGFSIRTSDYGIDQIFGTDAWVILKKAWVDLIEERRGMKVFNEEATKFFEQVLV